MITQPSSSRLLEVVRDELRQSVAPAVSDPSVVAALGMIDSILNTVISRCDHEVGWMMEEIADIQQLARTLMAQTADPDGRIQEALAVLHGNRTSSGHVEEVRREYHAASELLSRVIEVALSSSQELRQLALATLSRRLDHEVQIRGDFTLVGR